MIHYHVECDGSRGAAGAYPDCRATFARMIALWDRLGAEIEGLGDEAVVRTSAASVHLRVVACDAGCELVGVA